MRDRPAAMCWYRKYGTMTSGPSYCWVPLAAGHKAGDTSREARVANCPVDLRLPMLVIARDCLRKAVVRLVSVTCQFGKRMFFFINKNFEILPPYKKCRFRLKTDSIKFIKIN